jgi:integrase/recombinase XerC
MLTKAKAEIVGPITDEPRPLFIFLSDSRLCAICPRAPQQPLPDASYFQGANDRREAALWLRYLAGERRASRHTVEAYGRTSPRFWAWRIIVVSAGRAALKSSTCRPARLYGQASARWIESRSLLRALAAVRNFLRFTRRRPARTDVLRRASAQGPHSLLRLHRARRPIVDSKQRAGEARAL